MKFFPNIYVLFILKIITNRSNLFLLLILVSTVYLTPCWHIIGLKGLYFNSINKNEIFENLNSLLDSNVKVRHIHNPNFFPLSKEKI